MEGHRTIIVEGTEAELTDNLFDALTRIRHETEPAISGIYSDCVQCNMWMGSIDATAMDATEPEALEAAKGALDAIWLFSGADPEYGVPSSLATKAQRAKAGIALKVLMFSPWWSRVWTVQEATSPKTATVLWGPLSIPWSFMTQAAEKLVWAHYPPIEQLDVRDIVDNYSFFTTPILGLLWASRWIDQPHPSVEMLWRFRYRHSTDPRDKVHVILNLVAEGMYPLPTVRSSDYALDTAVLYRKVMLDLFRDEHGLRPLIGFRGEPKSVPGLPSWVSDWSRSPDAWDIAAVWEHNKFWLNYTADRRLPMLDLDELTSPECGKDVRNLYEMIAKLIGMVLTEEPRFRVISEVYWREALVNIIEGNYANPDNIIEGSTGDAYWRGEMLRFQRLFITENGAGGLGPSSSSIGDEVWVLSGGRSPFLLTPLHTNNDGKSQEPSYHYAFRGDVRVDNQRFVHIH
ncbi:heterokaryon incompatibility protein-domain-containing protein [Xylaria sp. FL1042]|nr:heterokaryon incompatibility protein-domain-containing protein [Xylaria sp. FL1042]